MRTVCEKGEGLHVERRRSGRNNDQASPVLRVLYTSVNQARIVDSTPHSHAMENPRESKQEDEEDDAECEAFFGRPFEGRERDLGAVTTVRACEWCVGRRMARAMHTWGRIHGYSKERRRCKVGAFETSIEMY